MPIVPGRAAKASLVRETFIPASTTTGKEAVWAIWPINVGVFPQLVTAVSDPLYWRVTSVTIAMEPAMSTSTQHCGVGLATSGAYSSGEGFGNLFKYKRACNYTRRSPVGGNVMVKWPISMPYILNDDAHKSTGLTAGIVIGVTNPGAITGLAWVEISLNVEYVMGT